MRSFAGLVLALAAPVFTPTVPPVFAQATAREPAPPVPTVANLAAWRAHLRPRAEELAWQTIPWADTFAEGVRRADAAGKPLLFWAMNGHPLGCT